MAAKKPPARSFPLQGTIVGGRLKGWHYFYLKLIVRPTGVAIFARVTPPNWPFPWDLELKPDFFVKFKALVKDKPMWLDAAREIKSAYERAGIAMPEGADHPSWATPDAEEENQWQQTNLSRTRRSVFSGSS